MAKGPTAEDARHLLAKAGVPVEDIDRQLGDKCAPAYIDKHGGAPEKDRKPKYKNSRTYSNMIGRWFDSGWECTVAERLWLRQKAGEISDLCFQVNVTLLGCINMRPDFQHIEDGELITHEAKGFETSDYVVKRKLWAISGPTEYRISYEAKTDVIICPRPTDEMRLFVVRNLIHDFGYNITLDTAEARLKEMGE